MAPYVSATLYHTYWQKADYDDKYLRITSWRRLTQANEENASTFLHPRRWLPVAWKQKPTVPVLALVWTVDCWLRINRNSTLLSSTNDYMPQLTIAAAIAPRRPITIGYTVNHKERKSSTSAQPLQAQQFHKSRVHARRQPAAARINWPKSKSNWRSGNSSTEAVAGTRCLEWMVRPRTAQSQRRSERMHAVVSKFRVCPGLHQRTEVHSSENTKNTSLADRSTELLCMRRLQCHDWRILVLALSNVAIVDGQV